MTKQRFDIQQEITDLVIKAIEDGVQPWSRPWATNGQGGLARRHDGTPYKGINQFLLGLYQQLNGFGSCYWMTFKQAKELGGCVRKGEKANRSVFFKPVEKKNEKGEVTERYGFWKSFAIFNASQIDGLPDHYYPQPVEPQNTDARNVDVDAFFAATGVTIKHGGDRAYLSGNTGLVHMPHFEAFKSGVDYYSTLAHECIHWSGLKRDEIDFAAFGSPNYAKEELIAEMGAAFMLAHLDLASTPRPDHASYIASWLQALKDDKKFIFQAASKAQARVDDLIERADLDVKIAAE